MPLGGSNDAPGEGDSRKLTLGMPEANKYLKQAAERIDYALDQIASERDNIKSILDRCKGTGFDKAMVRKAVMLRRKRRNDPDAYDEAEALLDTYMGAIGK